MKKLFFWILLIVVGVVAVDLIFGFVSKSYFKKHKPVGDYEMINHLLNESDDEILVLGSSVALNSINTAALSDSLGVKAYNGSVNGQSFPFFLSMLQAALSNNTPRVVILGITTANFSDSGVGKRYNMLAPYYKEVNSYIDSCLTGNTLAERVLVKSNMYRFNHIWFRILLYNFISPGITGKNGFIAKDIPAVFPSRTTFKTDTISDSRRRELISFLDLCKAHNIKLLLIVTPTYTTAPTDGDTTVDQLRELSKGYDVEVFDDHMLEPFFSDSTLFYDNEHININGSVIYTDTIVKRLRL